MAQQRRGGGRRRGWRQPQGGGADGLCSGGGNAFGGIIKLAVTVAAVIAQQAKDQGALTVGVCTLPFEMEGETRATHAMEGLV